MVYYLRYGEGPVFFEFDDAKSAANKLKHGIDFVEAQQLWADDKRVRLRARSIDEDRFMVIGVIGERHWTAFITPRGGSGSIDLSEARKETGGVDVWTS